MKFKLRDYWQFVLIFIICLILVALVLVVYVSGQEQPKPPVKAQEVTQVKTWKVPEYMRENLQREVDDFNKRFEEKVQAYKKELKTRFKEFEDMPDDVILYLEGGIFITRSDYLKLQEQLREKLRQEVKGDDKKTN